MITLTAIERIVPYVNGSDTGKVAVKLQENYEICDRFFNFIAKDLEERFFEFLSRDLDKTDTKTAFKNALFLTSNWLNNQWRDYIELAKHGLKTKASEARGDPAFIDTGNFYQNLMWELKE